MLGLIRQSSAWGVLKSWDLLWHSGTPEQVGWAWGHTGHASTTSCFWAALWASGGRRAQDQLHLLHLWAPRKRDRERTRLRDPSGRQALLVSVSVQLNSVTSNEELLLEAEISRQLLNYDYSEYLWGWKKQQFALWPTTKSLDKFNGAENCIWATLYGYNTAFYCIFEKPAWLSNAASAL